MSLKCPKCGKTFSSKSDFQNHLQDQHGMTQQEIKILGSIPGKITYDD